LGQPAHDFFGAFLVDGDADQLAVIIVDSPISGFLPSLDLHDLFLLAFEFGCAQKNQSRKRAGLEIGWVMKRGWWPG
jgi:hypothetical protein